MTILKLNEVAHWIGAELIGNEDPRTVFEGVSHDHRAISKGNLFVAIPGERVDGHSFIESAYQQGASAALISNSHYLSLSQKLPLLKVDNTVLALGALAREYRVQFSAQMVAVTGSCGKTTVKEMLACVFKTVGATLASEGNLNTEIGVPLSLLRLCPEHRYAVIEMGARQKGDIAYLMQLAQPNVALITNAGLAHLEIFGSARDIAEAKGEIFSSLKPDGIAVINLDEPHASYWKSLLEGHPYYTFGLNSSADFTAEHIEHMNDGVEFDLKTPEGILKIQLNVPGTHNVSNALAAAASAYAAGISLLNIQWGLTQFTPVTGRLQLRQGVRGCSVIDDTYNANPVSVRAALQVLAEYPGKRIFVMGDMLELGSDAIQLHQEVGIEARRLGIDRVFGIGTLTVATVEGFGANATHYLDKASLIKDLLSEATEDIVVLVKGSRSMRMEEIVQALTFAKGEE